MGLFQSPNCVGFIYFYLILLQAKSFNFFQTPALNRNEKVKCEDCGKEYSTANAARHRKSCQAGIISCLDCKYFTYNKQEMNYHLAKKHSPSTSKQSTVCSSCEKEFPELLLAPTTSEKRIGRNNGNQVKRWLARTRLWRRRMMERNSNRS